MFEKYGVLSRRELESRYHVFQHAYDGTIAIEGECAIQMARTMITPVAMEYQNALAETIDAVEPLVEGPVTASRELLQVVTCETEKLLAAVKQLEATCARADSVAIIADLGTLRDAVDTLEGLLPEALWPLPTYAQMMFVM